MESNNNTGDEDNIRSDTIKVEAIKFEPLTSKQSTSHYNVKRGAVYITLGLLFCVVIASFLFIARAVYIESQPTTALIEIDSLLKLKLADRYLLLSGEHDVEVQAEGYVPLQRSILVSSEQNQHFSFKLERLPGHLRVDTVPAENTEVFLDSKSMGMAPLLLKDISPGVHDIKVSAERYFPYADSVDIEGLDKEQKLSIELVPAWAEIQFNSLPSGADVFVDEQLIGQTPLLTEVLEGKHDIRIKLAGHKLWKDNLTVIASEDQTLAPVELEPADAVVFLVSNPPRANSTVDGEYRGLTPLELAITPGKKTTIRLFKQGYGSVVRTVSVASGEEKRLVVDLPAELVKVEFNTRPEGARLFINGQSKGDANQTLQLPAKTHRIEVKKKGFLSYSSKITPHTGIPQQVNINLKSELQDKQEKIKPVYTNSAGQTLKLFYPSSFTMGASRREPGRRANETLRNINMKRAFYLATHETTNAQFKKFSAQHDSGSVQSVSLGSDPQPVVKVTWQQAALYCNWLSKKESLTPFYVEENNKITGSNSRASGYRLPTEAEWAWAARMTGANKLLKFPWGDKMPPAEKSGNFADGGSATFLGRVIRDYNDGYAASAPVGMFPANVRGLFDMGGNVAEWIHDFYDIQLGAVSKPELDPLGPKSGQFHVIRGSSWAHGTVTELRLSYRDYNAKVRDDVGFRIARYLE